jgi:outer membrane protein OmpA-like peptidoglycan-associated protein
MKYSFLALALLAAGCAGAKVPPAELSAARNAYGQTTSGRASQLAPQAVLEARGALDRAEASFKENGDTPETQTLAYIAERKAEFARSAGRIAEHERDIRAAGKDLASVERETLEEGRRMPRSTSEALAFTASALQRERVARAEIDRATEETIDELHHVARLKRTPTGFIVTLSSPEVFDGDSLTDTAASHLDSIAVAVAKSAPTSAVTIESHADTDAMGDAFDKSVAQKHADTIAAYLATHGVAREAIKPVGLPPHHVDRNAADYWIRGLDRRIEIIVTPKQQ